MAITVTPQITGQVASSIDSYCYLYEPLRVMIYNSDTTAKKIYIDITEVKHDGTGNANTYVKFAEFDTVANKDITVDLMALVRQVNDAGIWKFSDTDEIISPTGFLSVLTKYRFVFSIYDDVTGSSGAVTINKVPIVGGRDFSNFSENPDVNYMSPITEFELFNVNTLDIAQRWALSTYVEVRLKDATILEIPDITAITPPLTNNNHTPCGGMLLWKSRLGGWMYWGFDILKESNTSKVNGRLGVGMFDSINSTPFIPTDYSSIENSKEITLKSLGLNMGELKAVSGIKSSMAIYFQKPESKKLELMRLTSTSSPVSTLSAGGDFSVTLKSISKTSFLTR